MHAERLSPTSHAERLLNCMEMDQGNRIRFEKLSERLHKVNIDILHNLAPNIRTTVKRNEALPKQYQNAIEIPSFFQEELDRCIKRDSNPQFRSFYDGILEYVQSLPEVIYHKESILEKLLYFITLSSSAQLFHCFNLIIAFVKDLKEDLRPYFHKILTALHSITNKVLHGGESNTPNPELCGKQFEAISHLLRAHLSYLSIEPDCLRPYYGFWLGHPTTYIREFAAKSFSLITRKLSSTVLRQHLKHVFKSIGIVCYADIPFKLNETKYSIAILKCSVICAVLENESTFQRISSSTSTTTDLDAFLNEEELQMNFGNIKKLFDLLNGMSKLLFFTFKGVKNNLHSMTSSKYLEIITKDNIFPFSKSTLLNILQNSNYSESIHTKTFQNHKDLPVYLISKFSAIKTLFNSLRQLFQFIHPMNSKELFIILFEATEQLNKHLHIMTSYPLSSIASQTCLFMTSIEIIEFWIFVMCHGNGRSLSDFNVINEIKSKLIEISFTMCRLHGMYLLQYPTTSSPVKDWNQWQDLESIIRNCHVSRLEFLFFQICRIFSNHSIVQHQAQSILEIFIQVGNVSQLSLTMCNELISKVNKESTIIVKLLDPMLQCIVDQSQLDAVAVNQDKLKGCELNVGIVNTKKNEIWLSILYQLLISIHDDRVDYKMNFRLISSDVSENPIGEIMEVDEQNERQADISFNETHQLSLLDKEFFTKKLKTLMQVCGSIVTDGLVTSSTALENPSTTHPEYTLATYLLSFRCLMWISQYLPSIQNELHSNLIDDIFKMLKNLLPSTGNSRTTSDIIAVNTSISFETWNPENLALFASSGIAYLGRVLLQWLGINIPNKFCNLIEVFRTLSPENFKNLKEKLGNLTSVIKSCVEVGVIRYNSADFNDGNYQQNASNYSLSMVWSIVELIDAASSIIFAFKCVSCNDIQWENLDSDDINELGQNGLKDFYLISEIFDPEEQIRLILNLSDAVSTSSYWLRIYLLRLFSHIKPTTSAGNKSNSAMTTNFVFSSKAVDSSNDGDIYNIFSVCYQIVCTPNIVAKQRELSRLLSTLEVWCREGKLEVPFVRFICGFCLGLLHAKFQPLWEPAVLVLVSAASYSKGENLLWPLLMQKLYQVSFPRDLEDISHTINDTQEPTTLDMSEGFSQSNLSPQEQMRKLIDLDGGDKIRLEMAQSSVFYSIVKFDSANEVVHPDSRTDIITLHEILLDILKRCPHITLKHSKVVVKLFLSFLLKQYYVGFPNDPENHFLKWIGIFHDSLSHIEKFVNYHNHHELPHKVLKKRLEQFLKLFAVVTSPKQLYCHQLLYNFYHEILAKPDINISKLALDCILSYKSKKLTPYKAHFYRLLDEKTLRDELIVFDIIRNSENEEAVLPEHRVEVVPLTIRLVFGRLITSAKGSKSGREKSLARRDAVLAFLSNFESSEFIHLVMLMIRGILTDNVLTTVMKKADFDHNSNNFLFLKLENADIISMWYDEIHQLLMNIKASDLQGVSLDRQVGFLHLLEDVMEATGFRLASLIPYILHVVIAILQNAQHQRESMQTISIGTDTATEAVIEINPTEVEKPINNFHERNMYIDIRTLCMQRITEIINRFHNMFSFQVPSAALFQTISPLLTALPTSLINSSKPPILLKLLCAFITHESTIDLIISNDEVLYVLMKCLIYPSTVEISKMVLSAMDSLLEFNNGASLTSHTEQLIDCFTQRFTNASIGSGATKLSDIKILYSGSTKIELELLCKVGKLFFGNTDVSISPSASAHFALLLLGMLRTYTTHKFLKGDEESILNILKTYELLIPRVVDVRNHIAFLSRLFGPATNANSPMNLHSIRCELLKLYGNITSHSSTGNLLQTSFWVLSCIMSEDAQFIGHKDFDTFVPTYQSLCGENLLQKEFHFHSEKGKKSVVMEASWSALLGPEILNAIIGNKEYPFDPSMCSVVIFESFRNMYDSDLVVRLTATNGLKKLVSECCEWIKNSRTGSSNSERLHVEWTQIITSIIMPALRNGIKKSSDVVKKSFLSLLCHCIELFSKEVLIFEGFQYEFHCDLMQLTHNDPEQNFFENITHIQFHRRVRAMRKLREVLQLSVLIDSEDNAVEENTAMELGKTIEISIGTSSFLHVLIPLVLHHILSDDFTKKDHLPLMQESASLIGSIALHLPWNHYYNLIKTLLRKLENCKDEKEKVLISTICSILDGFHFDLSQCESGNESNPAEIATIDRDQDYEIEEDAIGDELNPQVKSTEKMNVIAKLLIEKIYPWVKKFLSKEGTDHKGNKCFVIQPLVGVALTKLVNRFHPPLITEHQKSHLITNLLIDVIQTLKNRDVSARDIARDCLCKMINTLGLGILGQVIHELKFALKEGYQRHICSYTIRAILTKIIVEKNYGPPMDVRRITADEAFQMQSINPLSDLPDDNIQLEINQIKQEISIPELDKCIPTIVENAIEELVGETQEYREADTAIKHLIRESKGSKANDILEILAGHLLFRPTYALITGSSSIFSSIHALVMPLLKQLMNCDNSDVVGRIGEALMKVAIGLSKNPSVDPKELLLYIHATIQPFLVAMIRDYQRQRAIAGKLHGIAFNVATNSNDELNELDTLLEEIPSYLREEDEDLSFDRKPENDTVDQERATIWLPKNLKSLKDQKEVVAKRIREQKERVQVQDGASAPLLTGHNRQNRVTKRTLSSKYGSGLTLNVESGGSSDPAALSAVKFCLNLFLATMRRNIFSSLDEAEIGTMISPFFPMFTQCLVLPGAANIVNLSVQCIVSLMKLGVPMDSSNKNILTNRMLKLMLRNGASANTDTDLVQSCIKGLTYLFESYNDHKKSYDDAVKLNAASNRSVMVSHEKPKLPLNNDGMRSLLQLLTASIIEVSSTFQNSSYKLIREIIRTRVMLPEIYDLITKLGEQIVLSQRKGVRDSAASILVIFMIIYPLGEKRVSSQLHQLINNCSYALEDGRLSAIDALHSVTKALPVPVLEDHTQVIFIPMTLILVNDSSAQCRQSAANVIKALTHRVSYEVYCKLLEYCLQWFQIYKASNEKVDPNALPLIKTGSSVLALLLKSHSDSFKKSNSIVKVMHQIQTMIHQLIRINGNLTEEETGKIRPFEASDASTVATLDDWTTLHPVLLLLEQLYISLPTLTDSLLTQTKSMENTVKFDSMGSVHMTELVQECMLYPQNDIRLVSLRILRHYLIHREINKGHKDTESDVFTHPNGKYQLVRRLCVILNQQSLTTEMLDCISSCFVMIVRRLIRDDSSSLINAMDIETHQNELDDKEEEVPLNCMKWFMRRLQGIGTDSRGMKRFHVLKIYQSLIAEIDVNELKPHWMIIIQVILRAKNVSERQLKLNGTNEDESDYEGLNQLTNDLLTSFESKLGPIPFIAVLNETQRALEESKTWKKQQLASEAIVDPMKFAQRKIDKNIQKKESKKRKIENKFGRRQRSK